MSEVVIVPNPDVMGSRTGSLEDLSKDDIVRILGFEPNVEDDPYKVVNSWGFTINGIECAVWDYKGSHKYKQWSTFGPDEALRLVFGTFYRGE